MDLWLLIIVPFTAWFFVLDTIANWSLQLSEALWGQKKIAFICSQIGVMIYHWNILSFGKIYKSHVEGVVHINLNRTRFFLFWLLGTFLQFRDASAFQSRNLSDRFKLNFHANGLTHDSFSPPSYRKYVRSQRNFPSILSWTAVLELGLLRPPFYLSTRKTRLLFGILKPNLACYSLFRHRLIFEYPLTHMDVIDWGRCDKCSHRG